jgi:hypothetical protein
LQVTKVRKYSIGIFACKCVFQNKRKLTLLYKSFLLFTEMNYDNIKKIFRRISRISILIIILLLGFFIYWKYFFTYSEGYRAGLLQKFTRKGNIFKTFEGEMILSSVVSSNNVALASEKFFFSVVNDSLAHKLDTLQGMFVIVHYRQKNGRLPWKGDTPYFVDDVKLKR